MKRIITLLLLAVCFTAQSQHFSWLQTVDIDYNINPDLIGYLTASDNEGNIYLTGFKEEHSLETSDITGTLFYNKYNDEGELLFSKTFTGTGAVYELKIDSKGNTVLALMYINTITIGDLTLTSTAMNTSHAVLKFDPQGNLIWHRAVTIEGAEIWEEVSDFRAIALDGEDNIYIGYGNFDGCYITKYSPEGEAEFTIEQTDVARLTSVTVDNAGNIYAAGSCAGWASTFAGIEVVSGLQYNTYAVKYNAEGEYQWVKFVEDITCPEPEIIAANPDEIYFSSYLFGPMMFDDIETVGPQGMMGDFFLAKLNGNGEYQWVREVPGEGEIGLAGRNFMTVDTEGFIYIAGQTRWTIDWGNNITTTVEGNSEDALVLKYNSEGEIQAAKTAGGESYDRFDGIAANAGGDIYISGMSYGGHVFFDDIEYESPEFDVYPFLVKMEPGTLGISSPQSAVVGLYPNPATNDIYILGVEAAKGSIFNIVGQRVMDFTIANGIPIKIDNLTQGTYIIKAEGFHPQKFIKK